MIHNFQAAHLAPDRRDLVRHRAAGFSLIELMVSVVIGLVLIAGVTGIFIASKRNYNQDSQITPMQDNLRFSMALLQQSLEMTGFWGHVFVPAAITLDASVPSATASNWDCAAGTFNGFANSTDTAFNYSAAKAAAISINNATGATASAAFPCIDASELLSGTDVLLVRRLVGSPVARADLQAGHIYMSENVDHGVIYVQGSGLIPGFDSSTAVQDALTNWPFDASIFYIRNYYLSAGDGVPTLCRKYISNNGTAPVWTSEALAPGIENLQVQFGINTSPDTGLRPQYLTSTPSAAELAQVVTVRISLLARSVSQVASYSNNKTYVLGDAPSYAPADHFYRKMLDSTFVLRNPQSLQFYSR